MGYSEERLNQKRAELIANAEQAILNYWTSSGGADTKLSQPIAAKIIEHFVTLTAPEDFTATIDFLTMSTGGRGGARSTKLGNVSLNLDKLFSAVAGGVLSIVGVINAPWTAPFAAIIIWNNFYSNLKVDLSEREAAVLWTIWKHTDGSRYVSNTGLLDLVNAELAHYGRNSISQQELDDSLLLLQKIRCIQPSRDDPSKWWLREWVKVEYR